MTSVEQVDEMITALTKDIVNPKEKLFLKDVITEELVKIGVPSDLVATSVNKFFGITLQ